MLEAQTQTRTKKCEHQTVNLNSPKAPPEFDSMTFPAMKHLLIESYASLVVEENVYYYPRNKNFTMIDQLLHRSKMGMVFSEWWFCVTLKDVRASSSYYCQVFDAVMEAIQKLVKEKLGGIS